MLPPVYLPLLVATLMFVGAPPLLDVNLHVTKVTGGTPVIVHVICCEVPIITLADAGETLTVRRSGKINDIALLLPRQTAN